MRPGLEGLCEGELHAPPGMATAVRLRRCVRIWSITTVCVMRAAREPGGDGAVVIVQADGDADRDPRVGPRHQFSRQPIVEEFYPHEHQEDRAAKGLSPSRGFMHRRTDKRLAALEVGVCSINESPLRRCGRRLGQFFTTCWRSTCSASHAVLYTGAVSPQVTSKST